MCLLVAHQRCGNLGKAREILASMRQRGYAENNLMAFEQELNEPPKRRNSRKTVGRRFPRAFWGGGAVARGAGAGV